MLPHETSAALKKYQVNHPSKAKAVKPKTLEEELAEGGAFCFSDSDSDDEEPVKKKTKI